MTKRENQIGRAKVKAKELMVSRRFSAQMGHLLKTNCDIVLCLSWPLSLTSTMKMWRDTSDQAPIKLKPYRMPIHKRLLVEEVVRDMLEAGVIERSESP